MQFRVSVCEFLRHCSVERQLSQHTVRAYTHDLADFRKFLGADVAPAEISAAMLTGYLEDMLGHRKLSAGTVRRRFACLRAFFRREAERAHTANPFDALKLQLPRRKRLPRTLSRPEISSLMTSLNMFASLRGSHDGVLATAVSLMVATGIRVGELCRLAVDDVAPDGSSCRIHGKGSRDRVAYISDPALRAALTQCVAQRRLEGPAHGALFLNRHGAAIKPQSIRSRLRRYSRQIGLARRITPHMLRHTAATLLIETGVDIRFVQRLLGHSSIATTEIYTHVSDEALRATLERANILAMLGQGNPRERAHP
jgi:site-specific recombinase XerD